MHFERGALALVGAFVSVLIVVAMFSPPQDGTASPRASIGMAEPLILTGGLAPYQVTSTPIPAIESAEALDDFDVAAGPVGSSAKTLHKTFGRLGYHLESIKSGDNLVPRVFLSSLPEDMALVPENNQRKAIFFQAMLPLVLQVNEEILADRRRLWKMRYQTGLGETPDAADRLWLRVMTERYKVKAGDISALISRIDIIPPSLALAQAAEESGWGTSRFAKEGNAMFGQWTFSSSAGLTPAKRDEGKNHKVRAFDSLIDSVRAYTMNLNNHRAYKGFREARQAIRRAGGDLDGRRLAGTLTKYSERGQAYVTALRGLIDYNALSPLDGARLDGNPPGEQTASVI
ncbi:MAG: glucosaminidase domain-containing protein [Rhodospirillales bacterium]|nr:glucosaminidase domain-containing protein [Rhodospirillales bacterium]